MGNRAFRRYDVHIVSFARLKRQKMVERNFKDLLPSRGHPHIYCGAFSGCGCSSGVERNLAKVEVVSSNLITRSNFPILGL
jgi:hypothetical protein